MEEAIAKVVIPAVTGVVAGAIGSLFAPWANWGVEKKRLRLQARRSMVDGWRRLLSDRELDQGKFAGSVEYSSLRPHLSPKLVQDIENGRWVIVNNPTRESGENPFVPRLLDEIARIEKDWKLL